MITTDKENYFEHISNSANITLLLFSCFLCGVAWKSFFENFYVLFLLLMCVACLFFLLAFFFSKKFFFIGCVVWSAFIGAWYYDIRLSTLELKAPTIGAHESIKGIVVSHPKTTPTYQQFIIELHSGARVSVIADGFHGIAYHDMVLLRGQLNHITSENNYLLKDEAVTSMAFPAINARVPGNSSFLGALYKISDIFSKKFLTILPSDEAALAAGILIGQDNAFFSKSLQNAMRRSATTHLVALSGYNIVVVITLISGLLRFVGKRRGVFWGTISIIILFVLLTGADSSVVRAACMGIFMLIAQYYSRLYSFWHSALATACIMIVYNPFLLVFDIGFVLSFLSLYGVAVIAPRLVALSDVVFHSWESARHLVAQTIGAQLMTLPVLVISCGGVSFMGVISNIMILPMMPFTMAFSFVTGVSALAWSSLGIMTSLFLHPILWIIEKIIYLCGVFPLRTVPFSTGGLCFYYGVLFFIIAFCIKRKKLPSYDV